MSSTFKMKFQGYFIFDTVLYLFFWVFFGGLNTYKQLIGFIFIQKVTTSKKLITYLGESIMKLYPWKVIALIK